MTRCRGALRSSVARMRWVWAASLLLACGGSSASGSARGTSRTAPAPPDPLAWMPPGAVTIARIDVARLSASPHRDRLASLSATLGMGLSSLPEGVALERLARSVLVCGYEDGRIAAIARPGADRESWHALLGRLGARTSSENAATTDTVHRLGDGTVVRWLSPDHVVAGRPQSVLDEVLQRRRRGAAREIDGVLLEAIGSSDSADATIAVAWRWPAASSPPHAWGRDFPRGTMRVYVEGAVRLEARAEASSEQVAARRLAEARSMLEEVASTPFVALLGLADAVRAVRVEVSGSTLRVSAHWDEPTVARLLDQAGLLARALRSLGDETPAPSTASP
ncbi:MAG: hypothetical protein RMK74_01870 [Myxococcales bacterium]|nr:hypothetical protein [Myxococcales bacterium]